MSHANSAYRIQTVHTAEMTAQNIVDIFDYLKYPWKETAIAPLVPSTETMLEVLHQNTSQSVKALPFALLCKEVVLQDIQAYEFTMTYRKVGDTNLLLKDVHIKKIKGKKTLPLHNGVQMAYILQLLLDEINKLLTTLNNDIKKLPSTNFISSKYPVLARILKESLQKMPPLFHQYQLKFFEILHQFLEQSPLMSLQSIIQFYHELNNKQFSFDLYNKACMLYYQVEQSTVVTGDQRTRWLSCVEELLTQNPHKVDDILYYYFVGFHLVSDICANIHEGKVTTLYFYKGALGNMLKGLQSSEVESHQKVVSKMLTFFQHSCKAIAALDKNVECGKRMEMSAEILNEIARLYKMLETWQVPEKHEKLPNVYYEFNSLLKVLTALNYAYSTVYNKSTANKILENLKAFNLKTQLLSRNSGLVGMIVANALGYESMVQSQIASALSTAVIGTIL